MSRALQIAAAAISVIHVIAYEKLTESQVDALAEKRSKVKTFCEEIRPVKPPLKNLLNFLYQEVQPSKF